MFHNENVLLPQWAEEHKAYLAEAFRGGPPLNLWQTR
jgi:hypothetical protein